MALPENLMEFLLSGVIGLIIWIFKTVTSRIKEDFIEYKKEQEKRWENMQAELLRREAFEDRRRKEQEEFFAKLMAKHAEEAGKLVTGLWEELREFKLDRRRYDEETWKQLNALKDRQAQFELQQAKAYHTKTELDRLFQEKLEPIKDSLLDITRQLASRRHTDGR